jgi:hypothetical protein
MCGIVCVVACVSAINVHQQRTHLKNICMGQVGETTQRLSSAVSSPGNRSGSVLSLLNIKMP